MSCKFSRYSYRCMLLSRYQRYIEQFPNSTIPFLSPFTLGFATGRFVGVCGGLYRQYFPSRWGIVIFRNANPHLPPPQPVPVVVGHYIDRCIIYLLIVLWRELFHQWDALYRKKHCFKIWRRKNGLTLE